MGGSRKSSTRTSSKAGGALSLLLISLVGGGSLAVGMSPSCTRTPGPRPLAPAGEVKSATLLPPSTAPIDEQKSASTNYADAIRRRKFEVAAKLIDNATLEERKSPEVVYARGRVALELGEIETALRSAETLERHKLFQQEAASLRLEAAKRSQDVTLLVSFLGQSKRLQDRLLVAEAHEKNKSSLEARKIADEVLLALSTQKEDDLSLRARAHAVRARTFASDGRPLDAAKDLHWLATTGAALSPKEAYDEKLEQSGAKLVLSPLERMARLEAFSKAGLVPECEAEIAKLKALSPSASSEKETDALLAWAVYRARSDYVRAADLFARAASYGGKDRREHLYYEAKALARSHRDRDAIAKYEALAQMGGEYADHAAYNAARLRFIDGQWQGAVGAYQKYLTAFGKGAKHREEVEADLPIARLAAQDHAKAFGELKALYEKENQDRERANILELMGVARLGEKKTVEAGEVFRRVIDYQPLSFAALLAAARLTEMGESVPPWIQPASTSRGTGEPPLVLSLPEKVWRLSRVGLDEEAEDALRREEPALKKRFGNRSGEALCRLYGLLESAERRYQIAQTAASWRVLAEAPTAQTDWQWDCIYPTPYAPIVSAESKRYAVPEALVYGVMRQESSFRPLVVSPANAVGLMQIIPPTAARIAEATGATYTPDLMRAPAVNISFGTYYLSYLMEMFAGRAELVAASYNAGPQAVSRWLRAGESLPLDVFVAQIPYAETRNYVYRVMGNYARYAYRDDNTEVPRVDLKIPAGLAIPDAAY